MEPGATVSHLISDSAETVDRSAETVDRRHADTIDVRDFPTTWRSLDITVEVEAKAKELAVEKLYNDLNR